MCMGSQAENSIHKLPRIADFRLKCCIPNECTKNNITGRHPQLPKDLACQKVSLKFHLLMLTPSYIRMGKVKEKSS